MDTTALDTSDEKTKSIGTSGAVAPDYGGVGVDDATYLSMAKTAENQSSSFMQWGVRPWWARSYRSYRNQHWADSKYESKEYRGRSCFFRPKTRSAVKRWMAQAAAALFSTGDVVAVTAQNETDDYQKASAAIKQALVNYRLSRTSQRNGVRWFMVAMGAVQTGAITGMCISKQTWRYRTEKGAGGASAKDEYRKPKVVEDRPSIELIPSENCLFDPNCDWTDPVQSSQYFIVRYPKSPEDAFEMIENNIGCGDVPFNKITLDELKQHVQQGGPNDTIAARTAREGGKDPTMQVGGQFGRLWLNEVFMRVHGVEMVYWTLNNTLMLSKPVPVRQAYPAFGGERPLVLGYGELEAFRPYPMSKVESLAGMQMEINDQVNLRLDHAKQVVSPPAKVKRGQKVDLTQVQNRGPNGVVMVNDMGDVEWWEQPDVPPSMYQENQQVTADFDTLAGVFDQGSVANNRDMNETVGGMRLLAAAANPMADFDLNVFVETWAEPVLCQLIKLEEYYENDETVLSICGEKAQLFEKFGLDVVTDDLLMRETTLTVKLGVGASNLPEDKIRKLGMAWGTAAQILMPYVEAQIIRPPVPRVKEIINTIFSAAGFQDAGERFFGLLDDSGEAQPQQGNPEAAMKAQGDQAKAQVQAQKNQFDFQAKMADLEQRKQEMIAKVQTEHMKALAEITRAREQYEHESAIQGRDHAHAMHSDNLDRQHQSAQTQINNDAKQAQTWAAAVQKQQQRPQPSQPRGQTP
jgi:hypothetical protein